MAQTGFVPAGRTQIYYTTQGEGPVVLFLHAGVADSRMWQQQMALDGYRTIAFDQRGFGQTEWNPEPYAPWKDARAVLDHLDADSAVIVGCSSGGATAMQLTLMAQDRVDGLVLVGAAASGWEPEDGWPEVEEWDELMAEFKAANFRRVAELDAAMWLSGPSRSLDSIDPALLDLFIEMDLVPLRTETERDEYLETFDPPVNDRLDEIRVPVLTVVGEHDQPDVIESAHYLAGRISMRDAVVISDTAHLPSLEKPAEFNRAVMGFLDTL